MNFNDYLSFRVLKKQLRIFDGKRKRRCFYFFCYKEGVYSKQEED